jgi:hypothetical protein
MLDADSEGDEESFLPLPVKQQLEEKEEVKVSVSIILTLGYCE